ncbi:DUF4350 domain-containing protein [Flavobacterium soli]|uniref:DUF4350 domain-containing protein n=1 Tax=Flavobacterium soli TaxID=344881 RepID=UPI00040C7E80|nr:DUF4350 domain-containing protein [Flavobacterium soli]
MDKSLRIYIGFLVAFLALIVIIEMNVPKPIDWTPTYGLRDKKPLGMYVFNEQAASLLKNRKIEKINVTPYEYLEPLYDYDSLVNTYTAKGTFLIINEFSVLDSESLTELFYFADHGNDVFISMKSFPEQLLDSLDIELGNDFEYSDKSKVWMANPILGQEKYPLKEGVGNTYFSKIDTLNTTVLGYQGAKKSSINFIKVPYQNGNFYLHTQPAAFTNFHLLKDNHARYAEKIMSYIPEGNVYWYTKDINGNNNSNSPLRFFFSEPALRSAWYLSLIGLLIFMIFNAKRKQRIVPIIKPLENTTIDFIKTIGNLYFQEGDHDTIINKKIIYFLDKIRQDYLMETTVLDDQFIKKLHLKSGKKFEDIQKVVYLINQHRKGHFESVESDLIELNSIMEKITN